MLAVSVACYVECARQGCAVATADPMELALAHGSAGGIVAEEDHAPNPAHLTSEAGAHHGDHGA